jgi:hypothetical protein
VGLEHNGPGEFADSTNALRSATLSGRRLLLARVGWLVVFVLTIGLFMASLRPYYDSIVSFSDADLEPATVRAKLEAVGFSVESYATYLLSISVASAMVWIAVSVVIFWRRSDNWIALFTSLCLITFGTYSLYQGPNALADQYSAAWIPIQLLALFGTVSLYVFFCIFPSGRFVPRWTRWTAILFAAHEVFYYLFPGAIFDIATSSHLLDFVALSSFALVVIGSQLYRYRYVSGPAERQQTKWVVLGMTSAALGVIVFEAAISGSPLRQFGPVPAFAIEAGLFGSLLLIPLSIGVAIIHDRLWDIDVVINRTLVYSTLTAMLALLYFGGVAAVEMIFRTLTGQEEQPQLATVFSTLVIAALFNPLRRRIQAFIDRRFYRRKYDARKTLEAFSTRLSHDMDLEALSDDLVGVVRDTMQPTHVSLWLRPDSPPKREQTVKR